MCYKFDFLNYFFILFRGIQLIEWVHSYHQQLFDFEHWYTAEQLILNNLLLLFLFHHFYFLILFSMLHMWFLKHYCCFCYKFDVFNNFFNTFKRNPIDGLGHSYHSVLNIVNFILLIRRDYYVLKYFIWYLFILISRIKWTARNMCCHWIKWCKSWQQQNDYFNFFNYLLIFRFLF